LHASAEVIIQARAAATEVRNVEFAPGDVYALDYADASFDVVHAHQVLQHLPDPVGALREMRRVCKPDGVVAARDGDYGAYRWYPDEPEIDRWLELYREIARHNRGEPDAGRKLMAWAHAAGFSDVQAGASVWCFATADDRAWWAGSWADRMTTSAISEQAEQEGFATARRARGDGRRLAPLGRAARRVVRRPPRRDPRSSVGQAGIARPPSTTSV